MFEETERIKPGGLPVCAPLGAFEEASDEEIKRQFDTNVFGVLDDVTRVSKKKKLR